MSSQQIAVHQEATGTPSARCTTAAITPAPAGIGIPTNYFLPGRPGLVGCGLLEILKRARRLAPAMRNRKLGVAPSCKSLVGISGLANGAIKRKPHTQASNAGATPKVMTSASESR